MQSKNCKKFLKILKNMARVREFARARAKGARAGAPTRPKSPLGRVFWGGRFLFLLFCGRKASFGWRPFLAFPAEILGGKGFKRGGKGPKKGKIKKAEWQRFFKNVAFSAPLKKCALVLVSVKARNYVGQGARGAGWLIQERFLWLIS